jgi:hypothetical protein
MGDNIKPASRVLKIGQGYIRVASLADAVSKWEAFRDEHNL